MIIGAVLLAISIVLVLAGRIMWETYYHRIEGGYVMGFGFSGVSVWFVWVFGGFSNEVLSIWEKMVVMSFLLVALGFFLAGYTVQQPPGMSDPHCE